MPRPLRDDRPDDDDDRPAPNTGVPIWVWIGGGAAILTVMVCCGGLGLFLWVGGRPKPDADNVAGTAPPQEGKATPAKDVPSTPPVRVSYRMILNEYEANEARADTKYLNRRVVIDTGITKMGRDKDRRLWLGTHDLGWDADPMIYFTFAAGQDERLADLKVPGGARVEGRIVGRTHDGVHRNFNARRDPRLEYRIDVVDCVLISRLSKIDQDRTGKLEDGQP
ncbi:MAG TPA: hypothetical protein VH092_04310 [Urbifossiella sp.]|jgi:hypothetical protein|nr:hypothetical protein [Urbifossiella sp.]